MERVKGLSSDDVGVSRGTVFREIRAGDGFEIGPFVKEMLEGLDYTVELLNSLFRKRAAGDCTHLKGNWK